MEFFIKNSRLLIMLTLVTVGISFNTYGAVKGDVDDSGKTDLQDAIAALQICAGLKSDVNTDADVNNDSKIGLEEALYAIKVAAYSVSDSDLSVSITAHPENTLMAIADVDVSPDASVFIEFASDATPTRQTAGSDTAAKHEITVIGMRAQTSYTMTAVAEFSDGTTVRSNSVVFTTGALPDDNPPEVELSASTEKSAGGITFFGTMGQADSSGTHRYWGVDEQGEIVWYLHGDYSIANSPVLRVIEPGVLLAFLQNSIQTITASGEKITEYSLGRYHHEAILLPNGNVMMLGSESRENGEGTLITGDKITEKNADGQTLWEWSSFDHLDTTRFPGALSTTETHSGALDWSHSNALFYTEDEDTLLLSVRSQSWVVKIDHKTGNIIWIMGDSSGIDPAYKYNDKFLTLAAGTWTANQHAPMVTESGEILIFDNRNESGGSVSMSRAVKFAIDEAAMTATQTWEAVAPKYAASLGDADELSNGNVLMCAGGPSSFGPDSDSAAYLVEVSPDASAETLWSISLENSVYRTERMSWDSFLNSSSTADNGGDETTSYVVVDTGQTKCYGNSGATVACPGQGDEFYGQDGTYEGVQPAYQDNGNGTVTDLNTGLIWQQEPSDNMDWKDAFEYAENLDVGGYTDWRVPTIKELYSLAMFYGNMFKNIPYIDTDYFNITDTMNGRIWSANEYVGTTMRNDDSAFGFNFGDGRIKSYPFGKNSSTGACSVLCVRGGSKYGENDFVDNADGTVTDRATGLMWMKADSGTTMKWQPALEYAENLEYAGYSDWRLPNSKELHSIADYSKAPDANDPSAVGPAIDESFFELTEDESWFWTGTTLTDNGHGIYICFGQAFGYSNETGDFTMNVHGAGAQRSDPKTGEPEDYPEGLGTENQNDQIRIYNYVRCVRDVE
ncbi:MAG: DUF1566 domain-containing protein [Desulfobacterales bacterium]|nr:DUF1566 domain-containing protein [Desulfobacterales bacterium]